MSIYDVLLRSIRSGWIKWDKWDKWDQGEVGPSGPWTGDMLKADNLLWLASVSDARTNLWLGTLATQSGTFSWTSSGTNTWDQDISAMTHTNRAYLDLVSWTNTGDEDVTSIKTKLWITTLSGSNTGDQDISAMTHSNREALDLVSGTNTWDQDISAMTHTNRADLDLVSWTNTGDEDVTSIKSKLWISTLSWSNTGDESASTIKSKLWITILSGDNTGDENTASIKSKLWISTLSWSNTWDQTSIVGISGTKAQFNTAVSDGDIVFLDSNDTITWAKTFSTQIKTPDVVFNNASGHGIKVDTTSPTFCWDDLIWQIHVRTSGGTVPLFKAYNANIWQYGFGTAGWVTEVFNEFHISHDHVLWSDMFIHTHWSTITAPTGTINWLFDLSYATWYAEGTFDNSVTIPVTQNSIAAFTHMIAEVQCSAPGGLITSAVNVSITSGAVALTSASALFTSADIGRTIQIAGAWVSGWVLNTKIATFVSSTSVTVANAASTTVTAQPAFSYRVLDSDAVNIDGVILARTWRDSSRAADTLNVEPFLHYVDIHYLSTGIGTKQRNGPDFYT